MNVVLVEPDWNYTVGSKDWKSYMNEMYLPVGLLKLGSYYRSLGATVELVKGDSFCINKPDIVHITSLFTYWWEPVWECVRMYKKHFPGAKVVVGGIYASIMPEHCKQSGCDEVHIGLFENAEKCIPAYDLLQDCNLCVIHASRGCIRKCSYCYAHKLEPTFLPKKSIKNEIVKPNISFLDNNLLANPYIKEILNELITNEVESSFCLSGVDASLVTYEIAELMSKANFRKIRLAFDRHDEKETCERAISNLECAGYKRNKIGVFMLYNFNDSFNEVESRRKTVKEWGAKIIPQRYIPIPSLNSKYLHPNWTEDECRQFERNCSKW